MDIQKQHLCPRLVDYLTIVGAKPYTSGKGLAPVQVTMFFFRLENFTTLDYLKIIFINILLNTIVPLLQFLNCIFSIILLTSVSKFYVSNVSSITKRRQ